MDSPLTGEMAIDVTIDAATTGAASLYVDTGNTLQLIDTGPGGFQLYPGQPYVDGTYDGEL
jgi:hypothetical protein